MKLSTRPWVILIAQVLARSCCVLGLLETTSQDVDANNKAAAATGGGKVFPGEPAEPGAVEDDVILAARHCVALDGSRHFPADHGLGLFEMRRAGATLPPRITAASVKFAPQQRWHPDQGGAVGVDAARGAGAVEVSLLLEVDITDERTENGVGEGTALGLRASYSGSAGESVPTRKEVEAAAAEAAAATTGSTAEAQLAISALAAWNLVSDNGVAVAGIGAGGLEVRIDVTAGFGYRGDRYKASKSLALLRDDGYAGGDGVPLSASFDWQPTGDVWASLDGPAVADVKVYGAPSFAAIAGSASTKQGELLLLQATLCKRASPGVATGTAKIPTTASVQAVLQPHVEHIEYALLEADAASSSSPPPLVVVSEIEDDEWWSAREEEENGRGMDAVNALPRIPGWKPGDWKKLRRRRRRQEEERNRQRVEQASHRRAGRRGAEGSSGTGGRDGSKKRRRNSGWGFVKGAWRAVGRMLRGATGTLRRNR